MCPHLCLGKTKGWHWGKNFKAFSIETTGTFLILRTNSVSAFKIRFGSIQKFSSVRFNSTRQLSLERCFGDPHYSGWVTQETHPEMVSREMNKKFTKHIYLSIPHLQSPTDFTHIFITLPDLFFQNSFQSICRSVTYDIGPWFEQFNKMSGEILLFMCSSQINHSKYYN